MIKKILNNTTMKHMEKICKKYIFIMSNGLKYTLDHENYLHYCKHINYDYIHFNIDDKGVMLNMNYLVAI